MQIGLSGGGSGVDRVIEQAVTAEADGFKALWYAGAVGGDPLVGMAMAGKATTTIELGTAVLQTYPCHPVVQANRAVAVASAMGRETFTLGLGPSHKPAIEDVYGLSFDHPGRHTEEYCKVIAPLLRGEPADFDGEDFRVHAPALGSKTGPIPLLLAALGPRLLRVAGEQADGTILWMANAQAIESHVAPRIRAAAEAAGRPAPRIVAGLPVAVHDDVQEARSLVAKDFSVYGELPNYRRILDRGGVTGPADAAIIGDEASVTSQLEALFAAGATDYWAAILPVGEDRSASRNRTRALLKDLAAEG